MSPEDANAIISACGRIEQSGAEILSSVVSGSDLHRKIHNPVTEGIDEG